MQIRRASLVHAAVGRTTRRKNSDCPPKGGYGRLEAPFTASRSAICNSTGGEPGRVAWPTAVNRNYGYPYIDNNNAGSLKGALEALDATMKLAGPDTKLIPGHGTIINQTDLIPYRDMIVAMQGKVQQTIAQQDPAGSASREGDGPL